MTTTTMKRSFISFPISALLLLLCFANLSIDALSSTNFRPLGSAAKPLEKKRVACFGVGGMLSATVFGFLQRAGSLYETGMTSPIGIGATAVSSVCLNKILSKQFVLAFASEAQVRLCNTQSVDHMAARLGDIDAVVLSTKYRLEQKPITGGTYETSPNDKTYEFYFDEPRAGLFGVESDDEEMHSLILGNTIQACQQANVKHLVVVEAPDTPLAIQQSCAELLDECNVPFTYVRIAGGSSLESFPDHSYIKGVQGDLSIDSFTLSSNYQTRGYTNGDWMKAFNEDSGGGSSSSATTPLYREDVAALVVQALQSLDWSTSRCMAVSSKGRNSMALEQDEQSRRRVKTRHDREWCVNSQILAEKLSSVQ